MDATHWLAHWLIGVASSRRPPSQRWPRRRLRRLQRDHPPAVQQRGDPRALSSPPEFEIYVAAEELHHPTKWSRKTRGRNVPVTLFTVGGIATAADAAMMLQFKCGGAVCIGSPMNASCVINVEAHALATQRKIHTASVPGTSRPQG